MNATYTQPGRLLAHVADMWGVEVSAILAGDAVAARHFAVHQLAVHFPGWPATRIAATVWPTGVAHILTRPATVPPAGAARPVDRGVCTIPGCGRAHKSSGMRLCAGHAARWRRHATLDVDTPLRAVDHQGPVHDLQVHDRTGYRNGCRCDPCRTDAVAAVKRNRLHPQSRPVKHGLAALARLTQAGMSIPQIAAAAGIGSACLYSWRNARVSNCYQTTIDKLNAIAITYDKPCDDGCGRDALAGGRWCRYCMDIRFADNTPRKVRSRRQHDRRRQRRRRHAARHQDQQTAA